MYYIDHLAGRSILIEGEEWLYFSGTNYLGIAADADFQTLVTEGLHRYGVHFGGSRIGNLRLDIFEEAEWHLAQWTGAEAALTVSSGSLAGQLLLRHLHQKGPIHYAPDIHPALYLGGEVYAGSFEGWSAKMTALARQHHGPLVICCNAVDPLRVQHYSFDWVEQLAGNNSVYLIIDDSHSLGIRGRDGAGIFPSIHPPGNVELIVMSSLGKALGIPGGVILGRRTLIDGLWNSSFFGGASPPPPAFLYAFLRGGEIYRKNRARLRRNVRHFAELTAGIDGLSSIESYPVFLAANPGLAEYLSDHHVLVSSFAYPTPRDKPLTRIVVNSLHRDEDLERMAELLGKPPRI